MTSDRETLAYLRAERARRPEIADTLDLHIAILEARARPFLPAPPKMRAENASARLARGEPLLRADALALDWNAFGRLFQKICSIAARHRPAEADAFVKIAAGCDDPARAEQAAHQYLAATGHALLTPRHSPPVAPLLSFALNNALHPSLAAHARAWGSLVDDAAWYRAYCPICGGEADFSALGKEGGARRLLCSRCDDEWTFQRALCPFCGEDVPAKRGYYPGADGVYRLYTCENCRRYLKTIDLRELAREANLPAERVLTIGMDAAAAGAGYRGA